MQTMQAFYEELVSQTVQKDDYGEALALLMQAQPDELETIESAVTWTEWDAAD